MKQSRCRFKFELNRTFLLVEMDGGDASTIGTRLFALESNLLTENGVRVARDCQHDLDVGSSNSSPDLDRNGNLRGEGINVNKRPRHSRLAVHVATHRELLAGDLRCDAGCRPVRLAARCALHGAHRRERSGVRLRWLPGRTRLLHAARSRDAGGAVRGGQLVAKPSRWRAGWHPCSARGGPESATFMTQKSCLNEPRRPTRLRRRGAT